MEIHMEEVCMDNLFMISLNLNVKNCEKNTFIDTVFKGNGE